MKLIRFLLMIIMIGLAGCVTIVSTNGNLKIGANEKWDLKLEIEVPAYEAQAYGAYLTQSLDEFIQQAKAGGAQASWNQKGPNNDGNVIYTVNFNGTGFDKFNSIISSAQLTTSEQNGKQVIHFYMAPLDIGLSRSTSFELTGGNILQTNGTKVNSTTVRWNRAMPMEAVMEPPGSSGAVAFGVLIVILVIVGVIGYRAGWFRKHPSPELRSSLSQPNYRSHPDQSTQPDTIPPPSQSSTQLAEEAPIQDTDSEYSTEKEQPTIEHKFCPNCGAPWVKNARFCNRCGFRG